MEHMEEAPRLAKKASKGERRNELPSVAADGGEDRSRLRDAFPGGGSRGKPSAARYRLDVSTQYIYRDLRIAVMTSRNDQGDQLIRELQRTRAEVQHIWPIPDHIPSDYDVIYCDMVPDLPSRLDGIPGIPTFALVVILSNATRVDPRTLENCVAHAVIQLPVTNQAVISSLVVARSHFLYEQRLRKRINQLDENLLAARNIERAKTILMEKMGLNEEEAYAQLRRQAMERRITVSALASAIIDAQDVFKYN